MKTGIVSVVFLSVALAALLLIGGGRGSRWVHFPTARSRGPQPGCSVIFRGTHQPFEAVDVVDRNNAWAVSTNDVWRTDNGGVAWINVTPPRPPNQHAPAFSSIQAISYEDVWVLGSGVLSHTTDLGSTWVTIPKTEHSIINSFRFSDSSNGWAAGYQYVEIKGEPWPYYGAIYKTSDGGATWQDAMGAGERKLVRKLIQKQFEAEQVDAAELIPHNYSWKLPGIWPVSSEEVWAAGDFLFHSVDGGKHWDITDPDIDGLYGEPFRIGFSGSKRGWLIAHSGGYAITDDGGKTWMVKSHPGSPNELSDMLYLAPSEFWAVSGGVVYLSEDGGESWKEMARGDYKQISLKNKDHVLMAVGRDIAECKSAPSISR